MFLFILISSLIIFTIISVYNLFFAVKLKIVSTKSSTHELVSILIPARNEENNIDKCIKGAIGQDYQNKEIIVLDDNSDDSTFKIASSFSNQKVNVIKGKMLPPGWIGKNWACHQLSQIAHGEYLLFIDADVELKPEAITSAVNELSSSKAKLFSIFPTQIIKSFGEYLIVPLMNWILLAFLPLDFVHRFKNKTFVAANGQFMLWVKDSYFRIGGHEKVKNKVVEDMELAKLAKENQLKIKTVLGGELVFCRMYKSFNEGLNGFTKNFYVGFSLSPFLFVIILLIVFIIFLSPALFLTSPVYSLILTSLILITRISTSILSNQNWLVNVLLHPFQMIFMLFVGLISVIKYKSNTITWKSRKI